MNKWFVIITGINQEFLAEKHLKLAGYPTYCPRGRKVISHARYKEERVFAAFSRYLFIQPSEAEFDAIHSIKGILGIISDGKGPIGVSQEIIESLMHREKNGEFDKLPPAIQKKPRWEKSFEVLKQLLSTTTVDTTTQIRLA